MGFIEIFGSLEDPRIDRTKKHPFLSIIFLTISAVVAGSDTFTDIEEFGHLKEAWLKKYAAFPHGIPSHDTIGDLFSRLGPGEVLRMFYPLGKPGVWCNRAGTNPYRR
jgi:hypothetical protein